VKGVKGAAEQQLFEILVDVARGESYTVIESVTCEPVARIEPWTGDEALADEMAREFRVTRP